MKIIHLLLAGLILTLPTPLLGSLSNAIVIFSNYELNNTISMNRVTLQRIFTLRETRWDSGDVITVFIKPKESIEHRNFVTSVLNMTLYNYQQILQLHSVNAYSLTEVATDQKMLEAIRTHPGSIGYINYDLLLNSKTVNVCDDFNLCR